MKIKVLVSLVAMTSVILVACEKNAAPSLQPVNCNTIGVTYSNEIQGIVAYDCAYSTTCHAAGTKYPDFSTYAGIKEYADNGQLYEQLFVTHRMPPSPQPLLDVCTLAQIKAWINTGAPQ